MSVEAQLRAGWVQFAPSAATHLLALIAAWLVTTTSVASVLSVLVVTSGLWHARRFAGRRMHALALRDDRLLVDGEPLRLSTAWVARGWIVVRGVRSGRRCRLSLRESEIGAADFARVCRHVVAALPAVNRPRVAARRSRS